MQVIIFKNAGKLFLDLQAIKKLPNKDYKGGKRVGQ